MAQTRANIIDAIEYKLQDENNAIYSANEINSVLDDCLVELSLYSPYMTKESLSTTANSFDVDVSSLTDLIKVDYAEWKVDKSPKQYRNVMQYGSVCRLLVETAPTSAEDIYMYCQRVHSLVASPASSTLDPVEETLLTRLTAARLAISKGTYYINRANIGGAWVPKEWQQWGKEELKEVLHLLKRRKGPQIREEYSRV